MQKIPLYVVASQTLGAVRNSANSAGDFAPTLTLGVACELAMRLYAQTDTLEPYDPEIIKAVSSWSWAMDSDFDKATVVKLRGDAGEIYITDETATDETGEDDEYATSYTYADIHIPMSEMNTEEAVAYLSSNESVTLNGELVGYDETGAEVFVLQVKGFTLRNRIEAPGDPTVILPDYLNAAQVRALIAAGVAFQFSEDGEAWHDTQTAADLYFRVRSASNAAAAWSEPIALLAGAPGTDGEDGADGANGTDGASAYDIWIAAGNEGTEEDFLASLKGEQGERGPAGENVQNAVIHTDALPIPASDTDGMVYLLEGTGRTYLGIATQSSTPESIMLYGFSTEALNGSYTDSGQTYSTYIATSDGSQTQVDVPVYTNGNGGYLHAEYRGAPGNMWCIGTSIETASRYVAASQSDAIPVISELNGSKRWYESAYETGSYDTVTGVYEAAATRTIHSFADITPRQAVNIDTAIDASSSNPVTNAAIALALNAKQDALPSGTTGHFLQKTADGVAWAEVEGGGGGSSVTVDTALSTSSTNPVQNKAIATAINAKQDALPSGTTGYYLKKTASGVEWAVVQSSSVAPNYTPLYDSRVISPIEIDGLRATLQSLVEEMPDMATKNIVIVHSFGDAVPPTYPASKTVQIDGFTFSLGHTYQLTCWGGTGNYDGNGHYVGGITPSRYVTKNALVLPSAAGDNAGMYLYDSETSLWRIYDTETREFGNRYINSTSTTYDDLGFVDAGWYAGPTTTIPMNSATLHGQGYYCLAGFHDSTVVDQETADALVAAAWERVLETYTQTYTYLPNPDPNDPNVIMGSVYWAVVLDITPCVAGTCPLESRIATLEDAE